MSNWIKIHKQKPKGGQRFIGSCGKKWNLFTAPNHDFINSDGVIEMTKEQHLDKIILAYNLTVWMVPELPNSNNEDK